MSRYIDEISAIENFQDVLAYMGSEVKRMLKKIPTADVVEVRHGHWIHSVKVLDEKHSYHRFKCSLCGRVTARPFETDVEDLPYCHCGAKMDGERKEENEG